MKSSMDDELRRHRPSAIEMSDRVAAEVDGLLAAAASAEESTGQSSDGRNDRAPVAEPALIEQAPYPERPRRVLTGVAVLFAIGGLVVLILLARPGQSPVLVTANQVPIGSSTTVPLGDHQRTAELTTLASEMLQTIPVPQLHGLDSRLIRELDNGTDALTVEAARIASGSAACDWVESWIAAHDLGDSPAMQTAASELAAAGQWKTLRGVRDLENYTEAIKSYGTLMASLGVKDDMTALDGYRDALGCPP